MTQDTWQIWSSIIELKERLHNITLTKEELRNLIDAKLSLEFLIKDQQRKGEKNENI